MLTRRRAATATTGSQSPTAAQQPRSGDATPPRSRMRGARSSSATAAAATAAEPGGGSDDSAAGGSSSSGKWLNTARLLAAREYGLARGAPGFGRSQQRHITCERHLPVHPRKVGGRRCGPACRSWGGRVRVRVGDTGSALTHSNTLLPACTLSRAHPNHRPRIHQPIAPPDPR